MGKVIQKKIRGMHWWMKTSIVLLLTMATTVFIGEGWYSPEESMAANVTRYVRNDNGTVISTNEGSTNAATSGTSATGSTTVAAWRTLFNAAQGSTSFNLRITGATAGTWYKLIRSYITPNYPNDTQISNTPTYSVGLRSSSTSDQYQLYLIDFDPNGAAGNGATIASTNAINSPNTGTYTIVTGSFNAIASPYTVPAGHRLVLEVRYKPTANGNTGRIAFGNTATGYNTNIVANETTISDVTAPTAGTVTITPDISSTYTSTAPTVSTVFTDAQSAVTACSYTTDGGATWLTGGVVSGTSPTYTCTKAFTGLTGFLGINMRATSTGGTTTATQIQRTVDASVPTDGTLSVAAGNLQNAISWTAATDTGGSGIASYILRFATGATAPANCTSGTAVTGSPFSSATFATTHTGLTNATQYSYRLCATDNLGNTSGGVTKSATPIAAPPTTITQCGGCHGHPAGPNALVDANRAATAGTFLGSHTQHAPLATDCVKCHTNPTRMDHSDGAININATISGGTYTGGTTVAVSSVSPRTFTTTCNNTTCHGGASPVWGVVTTQATCTKCHGILNTTPGAYTADSKTAAPGYSGTGRDTGGVTAATDAEVGAHDTHLRGLNAISAAIACTECHSNVNAISTTFTGHMDGAGTLSFGALATSGTGTAPSYSAGTCSNTYCHYGRTTYATPATANGAVAWNNTAYLGGTIADCQKCHASPPLTTGSHNGITTINQCNGCHSHVTTAGTFSEPGKHINGIVEGGCDTCHGWPPTTNAHTIHITNIIAEKGLGSLPGGFVDNPVCGTCHNVSAVTKHAGDATSDGTSRNIYLPTPSTLQASYQFGASAVSYDKVGTTKCSNISCHFLTSKAWGTPPTAACQACHGYPPVTTASDVDNKHVSGATAVNHIGTGATVNTKATFVSVHGGCQICHGTESSVADGSGAQSPHANYVVSTQHATGNINMNGPTGTGTGYDATIGGCTAACHASTAPYRMTASGKTLTFGNYGAGGDCLSCHTTTQTSPIAQGLNAAVTSRVAIVPSFSLASKHTRSRGTAVTNNDCCVCHMEGDTATGSANATYHKNGYIELRDPDTGATIKGVTHSGTTTAAGAYTSTATDARPVRFSRNLGSATIEADTAAIMINQCLKCHDADGALSPLAIVPGGIALKPFAGTVTANPSGGVLNVAGQFASTNKSFHPVLVRQNSGYTNTGSSRMVAPWNGVAKTATTTTYGPLISCWDCHAPNGSTAATTLTTSGIHGAAVNSTDSVPLRGNVYVNGTTAATNLCIACHDVSGGTTNHGTGSAITSSTNSGMTYFQNRCYFCHGSYSTRATVPRPMGAGDAHGFNTRATGAAFPAVNNGYAFIRNEGWYANAYVQSIRSIGATTYTPTCGGVGAGGGCSRGSMGGYTPGGVY